MTMFGNSAPVREDLRRRLTSQLKQTLFSDSPVARALTIATICGALASGLFFTVSALFFTRVVGLQAATVALGLTIAGALGVLCTPLSGYAADRVNPHLLIVLGTAGQGLAYLAYVAASGTTSFIVTACCVVACRSIQSTARLALVAQTFVGPERVSLRARFRSLDNVFIGIGTLVAGFALLSDTPAAYRVTMIFPGIFFLLACLPLIVLARRLPPTARNENAGGADTPTSGLPSGSVLRDKTYLAVTALNAVMAMQFGMQAVGVPLWITTRTHAPPVVISVLLIMNTVLIALLQVRASRRSDDIAFAGRLVLRAGILLAASCVLYALSGHVVAVVATALLLVAGLAQTGAEMFSEAGSWGLAFELADPSRAGAYQGASQTGFALGTMLGPYVVTATAVEHGTMGWAAVGGLFLAAGVATCLVARSAAARQRLVGVAETG
ncbi:MFS transporter [Streptomyces sp. AA4]|nr:MFS transporter [Streptomyces sp. AA4]